MNFRLKKRKQILLFQDLGWITVQHANVVVAAYAPKGVEVFVRPFTNLISTVNSGSDGIWCLEIIGCIRIATCAIIETDCSMKNFLRLIGPFERGIIRMKSIFNNTVHVKPEHLQQAVSSFKLLGTSGWNVTIPHKQTIIPFLDELTNLPKKWVRSIRSCVQQKEN